MNFWIIPETGQYYSGERRTTSSDIVAVSEPPSPTAIAVIENGQHTGQWTEPPAPPPPPDWGQFATAMMSCPECEAWWSAVAAANMWRAQGLMTAVTYATPSPTTVRAALDAAIALVPPSPGFRTTWNANAATWHIPVTIAE
jgi:hypothetical protein